MLSLDANPPLAQPDVSCLTLVKACRTCMAVSLHVRNATMGGVNANLLSYRLDGGRFARRVCRDS